MSDIIYARVLSVCTPSCFFIAIGSYQNLLNAIKNINYIDAFCCEQNQKYIINEKHNINQILKGNIIFAFNKNFQKWGRCIVIDIKKRLTKSQSLITLLYIDYGNIDNVLYSQIMLISILKELTNEEILNKIIEYPINIYPASLFGVTPDFSFSLKPGTVGIKQVKSKPELCWGKLSAIGCLPHLQALTSNICDLIVEDCSPREHDYSTTHCDRMVGTSNNIKISYTREQLFQFNSQNNLDSSTLEKLFKLRILRGGMIKTYPCYSQFLPTPLNTHNKNSHINILHNDNRVDNSRSHLKKNGISGQEIFTIIDNEGILHKTHEKYKENEKDTMINVPLETGKFIYDQLCLDLNDEQDPDRNTIRILSSKLSRQKQTISQKYSPTSVHKKSNNIHLTPLKDCEKILPSNSRFICPLAAKESGKKKSHHKKSRVGWNYLAKLSRHLTSSQSSISTESSLSTLSLPDNATKNKNRLSRAMQFKNFNDSPVIPFVNYLIPKRMINHPLLDRRTKRISDKILNSPELFKVPKVIKSDENQLRTTLTPLKPLVKKSNSFIVCDKLCQQNIVTIVNNTSTIKTRANLINHIFPSPSKCKVDYNATDLQNHSKEAFGRKINLTEIFAMQPSSS
ncbi:uncharacterized protein LOC135927663 isoform X2 [Gordionus sp. m RMFG-2023]|uniref:uncharacterized protein LOC135927663 isoform X2 n=1 Tax=Gordionus sp. m RMFG-2023 TaxID=3053472 RepID=UPI0031FC03BD